MKIATWNVNGIRAREAQLCEWLERDQPDVVCLQELKADPSQIPARCNLADYHVFWHGHRGYSGVSLHIRKNLVDGGPEFSHPEFDMETRIVQTGLGNLVIASVYVPNGGKDYPAKLGFLTRLAALGVPSPQPLPCFGGRSWVVSGGRLWEVVSYLPGRAVGWAAEPTMEEIGALLGQAV